MKKKYEKPEMFMESFEVAEFIAGCAKSGSWQNYNSTTNSACYYDFGKDFLTIFSNTDVCDLYKTQIGNAGIPLVCYNTVGGGLNGFFS